MESTNRVTEHKRVNKPTSERVQNPIQEQEQQTVSQQPVAGRSIAGLPSGPGTQAMRQAAVLQMQRTHGNAHVMRQLDSAIQRQDDEGGGAAAGPSAISSAGARVDTAGGGVEMTGGNVKMHAPLVEADGILRADTIVANSVVASSYTPGAGNLW